MTLQMTNSLGKTSMSVANQLAVPSKIRQTLKITPGSQFVWYVEDNGDIRLKLSPENIVDKYYGVGQSLYDGTDAQDYVNNLRSDRQTP